VFECFVGVSPSLYLLIPFVLFLFISYYVYGLERSKSKPQRDKDIFHLLSESGKIEFYNPFENFLVLGGAGSGKTVSVGKPILSEYIRYGFSGFIYDFKDFDYTKTAYNLKEKYNYPYPIYIVNFTDMNRSHRFNVIDKSVIDTETLLFQVMDDFLKSMQPANAKTDEWYNGALGLLRGISYRFYTFQGEYAKYYTLPHILNFILQATHEELTMFLEGDVMAKSLAGAFVGAKGSEKTAASFLSTLNNYISLLATNKNVCWVLTGDDFKFYLNDPKNPKLFAISNNFALSSLISPIVAMLVPIASKKIKFGNQTKFFFCLDEMTTFRVNDFQNMPSTLREYNVSFLVLTQSTSKLVKLYGKEDTSSITANFANLFLGRTKDIESLKDYPLFFGKEDKEKKSVSSGSSAGNNNSSVTTSRQKEEVYDSKTFTELGVGEFILTTGESNVKRLLTRFKRFLLKEKELPTIKLTSQVEINKNYEKIQQDCEHILKSICGRF
jgi:type IV secretory pathway TraG/TraD family ATPase VirD4